ncbi:magnesium transporter CorA family protein [Candidatus Saccharibacteria bacterium TM7i]|nr:magnesium transporter CorA family protein [Candidatus Saccharibacteria bacterium TM7i]
MVRYFVKKSFNEELQEVKTFPDGHAWLYGSEVTEAKLAQVAEETNLDLNILRDVRDVHELPRVEYSKGATYVFVRIPRALKNGPGLAVPLLFVIRGDLLVTLSTAKYFTPDELALKYRFSMRSTTSVFLQVLSHIFSQYGHDIQKTTGYIHSVQQRLLTRAISNKDFIKFVGIENTLTEYHTNLEASKVLLDRLAENKHDLLTEKEQEFLDDIILYVQQLTVAVRNDSRTIESIRNTFSTVSNNSLNQRMKTLTLITLFLTVPNMVFGMFGMNVLLPVDTHSPWVFGAIIVGSITFIVLAYLMVRRYKF